MIKKFNLNKIPKKEFFFLQKSTKKTANSIRIIPKTVLRKIIQFIIHLLEKKNSS